MDWQTLQTAKHRHLSTITGDVNPPARWDHVWAETQFEPATAKLTQMEKQLISSGFTHVQLPKDKAPNELWPSFTWKDISSEYEGVFFRVVGGDAASFGQLQQYNAPRLEIVYLGDSNDDLKLGKIDAKANVTLPVTGWSKAAYTGDNSNGYYKHYYMNFKHSDIAEVRPRNMAIKVYKRTA